MVGWNCTSYPTILIGLNFCACTLKYNLFALSVFKQKLKKSEEPGRVNQKNIAKNQWELKINLEAASQATQKVNYEGMRCWGHYIDLIFWKFWLREIRSNLWKLVFNPKDGLQVWCTGIDTLWWQLFSPCLLFSPF